ncbi:MAG: DNA polymerase III subunit delta, partial [Bacilli bacterium]|nr:DNA polymerase III subunit delta [Bacilli bacterium]
MKLGEYLKKKQPLVYRTFANAIENKRLAHAYLLCGESGTPLLETAKFMAKSLICDHPDPLACEECRSCGRLEHGTYMDFHILGADEDGIKKEEVENVVEDFSKTPTETKGIMIYIIHLV